MKSVGEVMAIGRSIHESLQKALRGLETGLNGLDGVRELYGAAKEDIEAALAIPSPDRLLVAAQALREGLTVDEIHATTRYDPWFLERLRELVEEEEAICRDGLPGDAQGMRRLKAMGFSDRRLAELNLKSANIAGGGVKTRTRSHGLLHDAVKAMIGATTETEVRRLRHKLGVRPVFKRIDTCAAEFEAKTPYMYSTYEAPSFGVPEDESLPSDRKKVVILGGGPNRIGQGIEFDYCCVHAAYALKAAGYETVMVNCNPETVSPDYDTSDRLYFEPLTLEDVLEIVHAESQSGELIGVLVQLGGQTALGLAKGLEAADVPILGTTPAAIDLAEERGLFSAILEQAGLLAPRNATAIDLAGAVVAAENIGYPVLVRPSYVLGGRGMEILYDTPSLVDYFDRITGQGIVGPGFPLLVDRFLHDSIDINSDALFDGHDLYIGGIMEHIEEAGVRSGDSSCTLPAVTLGRADLERVRDATRAIAEGIGVRGLLNVQFALGAGVLYVLEANPRGSRTVPFVSKALGIPLAKAAARIMVGATISSLIEEGLLPRADGSPVPHDAPVAVKDPVLPFHRFRTREGRMVDSVLGPEMRSTGEVMGIDRDFPRAFAKSQLAAYGGVPQSGTVFVSVADRDKRASILPVLRLQQLGYTIVATSGTAEALRRNGIAVTEVLKFSETASGMPGGSVVALIHRGAIQIVINTPNGRSARVDGYEIRAAAVAADIPLFTTVAEVAAAVASLDVVRAGFDVTSLQEYEAQRQASLARVAGAAAVQGTATVQQNSGWVATA